MQVCDFQHICRICLNKSNLSEATIFDTISIEPNLNTVNENNDGETKACISTLISQCVPNIIVSKSIYME